MRRGKKTLQWILLALVICLSLSLVILRIFLWQPQEAKASQPISRASQPPIRIMPLGDSITYGEGSSNGGGYRWPLWKALNAQGARVTFVGSMRTGPLLGFVRNNQGMPGWTIRQLSAHVVDWLKTYQPQIILLQIGTNDFVKHDDPAHAPQRLRGLLDQITVTAPAASVIVAQITPLNRGAQLSAEVLTYNAAIPAIVAEEAALGRHVQMVDMYHAVSPSLLVDGIHPDDQAYLRMAQVWEQALLPLLKLKTDQDS